MTWITELITNLPALIDNIIFGFVFLFAYRWITYKDKQISQYTIIVSIFINYMLLQIFSKFSFSGNTLFKIFISFIMGFLVGLVIRSEIYNELLRNLNFRRNTRNNLWEDVISVGCWLYVVMDNDDEFYGLLNNSDDEDSPQIILSKYQIFNNGKLIADNSENPNRYVLLNTNNAKSVEITYTKSSPKFKK